jgi:hypothetical protein
MKRLVILLVAVVALIIGVLGGYSYASHRYGHSAVDIIASYEFGHAADTFTSLQYLRAGETNAVFDSLESDLDSSVISLRGILDDYPGVEHAPNYTNLLRRIADYRAAYPYHDDVTNMDATVNQVLAGIKKESH